MGNRTNLNGLTRKALLDFIIEIGEKSFRTSQLWSWIYQKGVTDFQSMTNLSKDFRVKLSRLACIHTLKLHDEVVSPTTQTHKFLWMLEDGLHIESVFIPEGKRRTICISSQVGCPLECDFCATGRMGFIRNLTTYEIVDQVLSIKRLIKEQPTNIVVMGMGDPFLNYENVIQALAIINDPEGIAIGHRKITISTSGIIPNICRYTKEGHPFLLAISLNATTNKTRSRLMPVNQKYPIQELIKAVKVYTKNSRKRVTIEYVLLHGINDTKKDADRLLKLLRGIPCKVNLITFNPTHARYTRPSDEHVQAFAEAIRPLSAPVTLRLSKGDDINGACGQLATQKQT